MSTGGCSPGCQPRPRLPPMTAAGESRFVTRLGFPSRRARRGEMCHERFRSCHPGFPVLFTQEVMKAMTASDLALYSDRLALKTLDSSFAPQVLDFFIRNQAFLKEWSPSVGDDFYTLAFQRQRLQADLALIDEGRMLRLWLFKKEDERFERAIGSVTFNNIVRGAFQSCHLGYQIDEQEINKGLMTE